MDLIYYRGLNCHIASIVNVIDLLGVNYYDAFYNLWSETDFFDDKKYNLFLSQKVFKNFETIGIKIQPLDCDEEKIAKSIATIQNEELFIVGMDTFYIPWHHVFQHFHDNHYFFAKKESENSIICFDPVYNKKNIRINTTNLHIGVFELSCVHKVNIKPHKPDLVTEAKAVLQISPQIKKHILAKIQECKNEGNNNITQLVKLISALINNRYMFQDFFHKFKFTSALPKSLFNDLYFAKWESLRNGLYKAFIIKDNTQIINGISTLFADLIDEEINMAKEIIKNSCIYATST